MSVSLAQELAADLKRHRSDRVTNHFPCVVIRRVEDLEEGAKRDDTIMNGNDVEVTLRSAKTKRSLTRKSINPGPPDVVVKIAFVSIRRMDIRAGDIVLVKNRDMVPADIILLASSGENGAAYVETSPIDGETNLKLRSCPQLPLDALQLSTPRSIDQDDDKSSHPKHESIKAAVKRMTRLSLLGYPHGVSASRNPENADMDDAFTISPSPSRRASFTLSPSKSKSRDEFDVVIDANTRYVSSLTSEAPNASVNTYSGKLTLPPTSGQVASTVIPLGAENILLRGAVLRNTEWAIGVACFTGEDTKLARNSIKTPSKFSKLDELMNRTVVLILFLMLVCVTGLAVLADYHHKDKFDYLWYASYNYEGEKWPYLPDLDAPVWNTSPPSFLAFMLTFVTLLNNFVPLSLYVTVEMITLFMMLLIGWDKDMYHKETDTPAAARSTTVTDLGQVKYVFSDKTGTLTQNVMKFKRCSVDGLVFGAPIQKSAPAGSDDDEGMQFNEANQEFHPLKRLLVGSVALDSVEESADGISIEVSKKVSDNREAKLGFLTFNAEMFLRVMAICHTVVVEKEIDASNINTKSDHPVSSAGQGLGLGFKKKWNRSRTSTEDSTGIVSSRRSNLGTVVEATGSMDEDSLEAGAVRSPLTLPIEVATTQATPSVTTEVSNKFAKAKDGSPSGCAYQAESPDEEALVSAASNEYDFQLVGRDSDGVKVQCSSPSLLSINEVVKGLKTGRLGAKELASVTASPTVGRNKTALKRILSTYEEKIPTEFRASEETWQILAVNKFDSDRKRMSVVVRSPLNLGSIPMLMCKGADSSMLDPSVCEGGDHIMSGYGIGQSGSTLDSEDNSDRGEEWESSVLLGMQSHLGVFASEGLRTLVLGVRILAEEECEDWMAKYNAASSSMKDRTQLLTDVAMEIETKLHIVGATAIEDKLQDGVPETICNIGKAGIKLWVLTGDKRETAIEIGYSTKVLNPKMHLTDVADGSEKRVKALVAMEFMRLVKIGKLPQYQKIALEQPEKRSFCSSLMGCLKIFGSWMRSFSRAFRRFYHSYIRTIFGLFFRNRKEFELSKIDDEVKQEELNKGKFEQVRSLAESILKDYLESSEGQAELNLRRSSAGVHSLDFDGGGDSLPAVFNRAESARRANLSSYDGHLSQAALRSLTIGSVTADTMAGREASAPVVDEDTLSLVSFVPGKSGNVVKVFNKKKRTLLEKMFAVDRDVRKGNLVKHLTREKKEEYYSFFNILPQDSAKDTPDGINANVARALVIEGSALVHFLNDELLEEILFSVASNCESVIACRVSPKQKALLVKLVKQFVKPEPVTLAIGDGANDVGMIQEAQIGVGISGLEGQQAVNASDFSIAQFRFLEDLLLIHGRWNFMRLSKTVLYSFYKNAVLAGLLIVYCRASFYSGTPLFDMWVLSGYNFVLAWPILLYGMFDRDLDKDYVKKNPHLYAAGPNNEHMAMRTTMRWVALVFFHVQCIYFLCVSTLDSGGVTTPAFKGLMRYYNTDHPGDGDGGGLKIFGTTVFMILVWTLGIKVLFESGSIIHGKWPAFTCRKDVGEGFWSRVAYTWYGLIVLSIGLNFLFVYTYQLMGRSAGSAFAPFVMVTDHLFHTRTITWVVIVLVTVAATSLDVVGKVFSNMYYPTQTQIHREIQKLKFKKEKRAEKIQILV